jgi:hypothetical protein
MSDNPNNSSKNGPHANLSGSSDASASPASGTAPAAGVPSSGTPATPIETPALQAFASTAERAVAVSRQTSLQNYHMLSFRKALHPEFFGIEGRQRVQHGEYETEAWIFRGGHSVRFQLNGFCMSEIVVEHIDQIPDRGLIAALPCAGERDFEEKVAENLVYMTTMQTETLSDHLYLGTYKEMMQHARENNSLLSAWTDAAGKPNLSLVDVQHFRNEVHIQGYHLRSDCGLVLRTQSMVQIVPVKKGDAARDKKAAKSSLKAGGTQPGAPRTTKPLR